MKLIKSNKNIIPFCIATFLFIIVGINVNASDENATFNINPIIPNNQYNKSNTYIDILYTPGSRQNIQFKVSNSNNNKETINVEANDATTSNGLVIDYSNSNNKLVNNPKFSNLLNGHHSQKIILNAKESKIVTFSLNMPQNRFKGIILGGISAYIDDDNNKTSSGSGVNFSNKFVFANPVVLRNEKGHVIPNIKFIDAKQESYSYTPSIMSTLINKKRNFINDVKTKTTIKDSNDKVITTNQTDMGSIAPSSEFKLPTPLNNTLRNGEYIVIGEMTGNNGQKWNWKHKFTVTDSNSNIVEKNILKQPDPLKRFKKIIFILLLFISITIILIIILILLLFKKKKKNNEK
ncbi:DUF916 domain-containing protein [Apilactobacillus micheneri]|uniref:DUF916 domain-containing protein n=1 Tax=Apilactobacillus micheneri TaxID=1899430 RepID=UPI0015E8412C|nr:DUF916 domain-containing protein [Apilactobacillus micheneri]